MAKALRKQLVVDDLRVNPDAQRRLVPGWSKAIARNFNREAIGFIAVSERQNGKGPYYNIIDGQHRVDAMRQKGLGHSKVNCLVYSCDSDAEEAVLFDQFNTSKSVKSVDRFLVRVTAGDEVACEVSAIVGECGLVVASGPGPGHVMATSAMEGVYTGSVLRLKGEVHPETLRRTLNALRAAWSGETDAYHATHIKALGAFLLRYPDIDYERLVDRMKRGSGGPSDMLRSARALCNVRRMSVVHAMCDLYVDLHNTNLRTNRLQSWTA